MLWGPTGLSSGLGVMARMPMKSMYKKKGSDPLLGKGPQVTGVRVECQKIQKITRKNAVTNYERCIGLISWHLNIITLCNSILTCKVLGEQASPKGVASSAEGSRTITKGRGHSSSWAHQLIPHVVLEGLCPPCQQDSWGAVGRIATSL